MSSSKQVCCFLLDVLCYSVYVVAIWLHGNALVLIKEITLVRPGY